LHTDCSRTMDIFFVRRFELNVTDSQLTYPLSLIAPPRGARSVRLYDVNTNHQHSCIYSIYMYVGLNVLSITAFTRLSHTFYMSAHVRRATPPIRRLQPSLPCRPTVNHLSTPRRPSAAVAPTLIQKGSFEKKF